MSFTSLSATKLCALIKKKEIKAEEIILAYLERIKEQEKDLSAFLTVLEEKALASAKKIDRKKEKGRLAGVPVAIKDNILTKGIRTTCASKILENYIPPYSATVVKKLEKEDAIIIGKTNLDEFSKDSYYQTLDALEKTGAELREIDFPSWGVCSCLLLPYRSL